MFTESTEEWPNVLNDTTLLITLVHHQQKGVELFKAGDEMRLIRRTTLRPYGNNKVKSSKMVNIDYMIVELEKPMVDEIATNDSIENTTWNPEVIVRNCNFRGNRARGPLLTSPKKILIENNTFYIPGCGLLVEGDCNYWFESGAVNDITIKNNLFEECTFGNWGKAVFQITPQVLEFEPDFCYHRNITIQGNTFKLFDSNLLFCSLSRKSKLYKQQSRNLHKIPKTQHDGAFHRA